MKKLLFIYNAYAGKGQVKTRLPAMLDLFTKAGWQVTAHPTQGAGDAAAVAARLGGEFDRIICAGGDGTLHEVVTGLMEREDRPEIGYVPAGTTNDFAKNLHLPRGMENMARTAAAGDSPAGGHRPVQRAVFYLCGRLRGLYRRGLQYASAV